MFSTILIIVLLLIVWFLSGAVYMLLSIMSGPSNKLTEAFFMLPVNFVLKIVKTFSK